MLSATARSTAQVIRSRRSSSSTVCILHKGAQSFADESEVLFRHSYEIPALISEKVFDRAIPRLQSATLAGLTHLTSYAMFPPAGGAANFARRTANDEGGNHSGKSHARYERHS